ncbi:hypothetical protein ADL03_27665 [Nocardia sp. NRRL S-836]|nr:hypothetical protein ADL03_27665 [Nocardia sp. NRRL S-836]
MLAERTGLPFGKAARLHDAGGVSCTRADWTASGWHRLLPPIAFSLEMLIATATQDDADGDLDDLIAAHSVLAEQLPDRGATPLRWHEAGKESVDLERRREQARETLSHALAGRGLPVPTTLRELADLLAQLGVYHHTRGTDGRHRWRALQLPVVDLLDLPAEWLCAENDARWLMVTSMPAARLHRALVHSERVPTIPTSIDRLASDVDATAAEVRLGLEGLLYQGVLSIERRGAALDSRQVREVPGHARIDLRMDWERIPAPDISTDIEQEMTCWNGSPWSVYRAVAADRRIAKDTLEVLSFVPFVKSTPDGRMSETCLAEFAASSGGPMSDVVESLFALEARGFIRWNNKKQRVEGYYLPTTAGEPDAL